MTTTAIHLRELWNAPPADPDPEPENPYRVLTPYLDPFPSDSFYNVPIGSGITTYSTSDTRTTKVRACVAAANTVNWTDPFYQATSSDPLCTLEWRSVLPSGWQQVTKSALGATGATTTTYPTYQVITGLRIPAAATWESTSNTDRKVIINQGFAVTLTIQTYVNNVYDSTQTVSYPAGALNIEAHKFYRTTASHPGGAAGTYVYCTNLSLTDVAADYGMTKGAIASGISPSQGYVRSWEVGLMAAGDNFAIKHALKVGGSLSMFKWDATLNGGAGAAAIRWPSRTADGHATAANYLGPLEYGAHVMLPADFDVETFVNSRVATVSQRPYCKSMLNALKYFGAYFLITAGTGNVISYGFEPKGNTLSSAIATTIKTVLNDAHDFLLVSSNSHTVGTLATNRQPVSGASVIAGGGARRTVGLGWDDFDNATGLKLPFDPAGPWV